MSDVILAVLAAALLGSWIYYTRNLRQLRRDVRDAIARAEQRDAAKRVLNGPPTTRPLTERRHLRKLPVVVPLVAAGAWAREHPGPATAIAGTTAVMLVLAPASIPQSERTEPPLAAPPSEPFQPPRTIDPGEPLDPGGPPGPAPPSVPLPPPTDIPAAPPAAVEPSPAGTPASVPTHRPPRPLAAAAPREDDDGGGDGGEDELPTCFTRLQLADVLDLCVPELPNPPNVGALGGQPQPVLIRRPA